MRIVVRSGLATRQIWKALWTVVTITMISSGSNVAFGQRQHTLEALSVYTNSPVEILLTDPQGRQTGFDPAIHSPLQGIPLSVYSITINRDEQNFSPDPPAFKTIYMADQMDGQYTLDVIGTGSGDFTVGVRMSDAAGNWITQSYSGTTAPGRISRFTFPGKVNVFAAFEATLKVNPASKAFEVHGTFTLGPEGIISLGTQPASIDMDNSVWSIPAGSFTQARQGTNVFAGSIQGVQFTAELTLTGSKSYTFQIKGAGVPDPPGLPSTNPVEIRLAIGNNGGSTSVNATFVR